MPGATDGEAQLHQPFVDASKETRDLAKECTADGKADSMLSVFLLWFSFPEEGVATFWFTDNSLLSKTGFTEGSDVNPIA